MIPVVIAENGIGLPVREVEGNAPEMIVAENGLGIPIVLSDLGQPFVVIGAAPFRITLTGLSGDSLGAYGQIGNHAAIGFTATASGSPIVPDSWKWSADPSQDGAATFGTGSAPTDFAAADGFQVYLHVVALGAAITRSFPVRRAPGAFSSLVPQTFTAGTGPQTYTFAAATGAGLTWTYSLISAPVGVTLSGRTLTINTSAMAPQISSVTVRASDQYPGRFIDASGLLTIQAASAPSDEWVTEGGPGAITITSQPAQPAAPLTLGGNGSITVTG